MRKPWTGKQGDSNSLQFFRAELCRRLGRIPEARASYQKALSLAPQESDRRFLTRRLAELK